MSYDVDANVRVWDDDGQWMMEINPDDDTDAVKMPITLSMANIILKNLFGEEL